MKKCTKCQVEKENSEFHVCNTHKDKLSSWCKPCAISNARKFYQKDKQPTLLHAKKARDELIKIMRLIKSKYGCYFCQEKEACCLDFHHQDDNKLNDVSAIAMAKSKRKLIQEINKCIVVCSNCHRKIHNNILVCNNFVCCNENVDDYFDLIGTLLYFRD